MTPKQFKDKHGLLTCRLLCERAGINYRTFLQACYGQTLGKERARALARASEGQMTLEEILFANEIDAKAQESAEA